MPAKCKHFQTWHKTKNAALACGICCFIASGGDKEIRTLDPLLAKQVLYQLSYTPFQ